MDTKLFTNILSQAIRDAAVTFFKVIIIGGIVALALGLINELALKQSFISNATFAGVAATSVWIVLSVFMVRTGYRSLAPLRSQAWLGGLILPLFLPLLLIGSAFVYRGSKGDAVAGDFISDPLKTIWVSYLFIGLFGGFQLLVGGVARSLKERTKP